jgi:hypothetical protein
VKVVIEDASVGAQSGIELGYDAAPYPSIVWLPVV